MERVGVSSSSLVSVGYDSSISTLEVEFHGGAIYQYFGVPQSHHDGLLGAGSKGGYLDANIKKGGYSYARIS